MEKIDNTPLDDIEIPEGLEDRLLSKIDMWAQAEREERDRVSHSRQSHKYGRQLRNWASAAAVFAVLILSASIFFKPTNRALTDSFDDSKRAYIETVNALAVLSETLSMGMDKIEAIDLFVSSTDSVLSPTIKVLSE